MCFQAISTDVIEAVCSLRENATARSLVFLFLDSLAIKRPSDVMPYDDYIAKILESNEATSFLAAAIFVKLAIDEVTVSNDRTDFQISL